ncbi:CheR family methyltransferase [Methyloterricola oryzae]|uniref:CheR family methyltransferase n=1 Tax=Methyloterricola oryzae TaxID=1495050 RepID=UPI0005EAEA53|nr:CheR family methyltransferase [Methyloterricola oryzae]
MSPKPASITEREFSQFSKLIYDRAGIHMPDSKMALVSGRLAKRIQHYQLESYGDYFRLISGGEYADELQTAIDLLTTNETHFFREPKHMEFLRDHVLSGWRPSQSFRLWCAASSTGEEPYTLAMVLADTLGNGPWEITGSDISMRCLEKARGGLYAMQRAAEIPKDYLRRFCLRGVGSQSGQFLIERGLRERVRFLYVNLIEDLPELGQFDTIFLRNVMIYFDIATKRRVISRMLPLLRKGGYFIISHSESLNGVSDAFEFISPSIYRKP